MKKKEISAAEEQKVTIEVLVEGSGGELVFKPVQASPHYLKELLEASKNPVIKRSIERAAKEKNIKL